MYKLCFNKIVPLNTLIDASIQRQLENCYFRYFKSYKTVCSEAHKYDDDFIYEDDGDEDDEDYEDDEEEDGFS